MFWIGQAIILIAGLIGIGLIRRRLRGRLRNINDSHLDYALIALLLIGIGIGSATYLREESKTSSLTTKVDAVAIRQESRSLDPATEKRLIEYLIVGPKGSIGVDIPIVAGAEAQAFSGQLEQCLAAAGWSIKHRAVIPFSNRATGVFLSVKSSQTPPERAESLRQALSKVGVEATYFDNLNHEPDDVDLIIARKPD